MTMLEAHARLLKLSQPILYPSDVAACLNVTPSYASKILSRLGDAGFLVQLAKGRWAIAGETERLMVPEYLTSPMPSYISLQTALYYHGMISQIPEVTYAVSLTRTKRYETQIGTFSIHHISPEFFFGYESNGKYGIKMASPEKALIDLFYLAPARSRLFKALPELELTDKFSVSEARSIIRRIPSVRRQTIVSAKFDELVR